MPAQSKAQQRFFGVVKAMQKGDKPKKGEAGKVAKSMDKDDVDKYAKTKHKGLPNKVKREQRVRELIKKMVREIMMEDSLPTKVTDKYKKLKFTGQDKDGKFKQFMKHHMAHSGQHITGLESEPETYDFDDSDDSKPDVQKRKKDKIKRGYEPVVENTVRISTMKDVSFAGRDRLQLVGKKGKLGLDRKSVSALVKAVRKVLGRSFTTHEAKLNEAKTITLPNGVKAKIEFKGITLQAKGKKPVFLDRTEMMTFFKATQKYMKQGLAAGKVSEGTCGYGENGELGEEPAGPHLIKKKIKEVSGVDVAKKVLKNKQHEKGIDMQTANLIVTIHKAYNKNKSLQKKFEKIPLNRMKELILRYMS